MLSDNIEYENGQKSAQNGQKYTTTHGFCPTLAHYKDAIVVGHARRLYEILSDNLEYQNDQRNAKIAKKGHKRKLFLP